MHTTNDPKREWKDIDTKRCEHDVHRLQCKIFEASLRSDTEEVHKQQRRLLKSFQTKVVAVRKVTEIASGKKTAGVDGIKKLSDEEKYKLASTVQLTETSSRVRRVYVPKHGSTQLRPLGIPTIRDRVRQTLIAMALEPQWEARFPAPMFGFRKGRGTHDAIAYLQNCLRKSPRWVLDADIEKFFDSINHSALVEVVDAPEEVLNAIRGMLKAEIVDHGTVTKPTCGTPQGGPLSSLLANIAMSGMIPFIEEQYRQSRYPKSKALRVIIYADDMVILHESEEVVRCSQQWVKEYLDKFGLNLSTKKTRICHTLEKSADDKSVGFDFLSVHFQHHARTHKKKRGSYHTAKPSKSAQSAIYKECADLIKGCKILKKHRTKRKAKGSDPVELLIVRLNKKLKGWANYHKTVNSKEVFSRTDSLIFDQLWRWTKKQFKGKNREWMIDNLYSGVEVGNDGEPLKKLDGTPRERSWIFMSPFISKDKEHSTLMKLADTPIIRPTMVQMSRRYYDNDWIYWGARNSRYPGIPLNVNKAALKRTGTKCTLCKKPFTKNQMLAEFIDTKSIAQRSMLVCTSCITPRVKPLP